MGSGVFLTGWCYFMSELRLQLWLFQTSACENLLPVNYSQEAENTFTAIVPNKSYIAWGLATSNMIQQALKQSTEVCDILCSKIKNISVPEAFYLTWFLQTVALYLKGANYAPWLSFWRWWWFTSITQILEEILQYSNRHINPKSTLALNRVNLIVKDGN